MLKMFSIAVLALLSSANASIVVNATESDNLLDYVGALRFCESKNLKLPTAEFMQSLPKEEKDLLRKDARYWVKSEATGLQDNKRVAFGLWPHFNFETDEVKDSTPLRVICFPKK